MLLEYEGERISDKEALKRHGTDPENPYHTFFFSLESGKMIDGGADGSDAPVSYTHLTLPTTPYV